MNYQDFQKDFNIYFRSPLMKDLADMIIQIAPTDITVLIYGESGTGKELVANAIHSLSHRSAKRMFSVNCGAIPEGIIESELFGHQKGSFTGATDNRRGYFELAENSTLFLDEIAELPIQTQVKFLRVLENREILKVGSETVTKIDVRLITATNKYLAEEVQKKKFREDLFFRLRSVTIEIPPLRKRKEDIPLLANKFLIDFCTRNKIAPLEIEPDALELLIDHNWPGNVRELRNTIETATALNKNSSIAYKDLERIIHPKHQPEVSRNLPVSLNLTPEEADRAMILKALIDLKRDITDIKVFLKENYKPANENEPLFLNNVSRKNLEKEAIVKALVDNNFDKKKAAQVLKISLKTLYRRLKEYEL